MDTIGAGERNKETECGRGRGRGRWKKRVLTGKNAQWGSKPAYQLTGNQMEGERRERRGVGMETRWLTYRMRTEQWGEAVEDKEETV